MAESPKKPSTKFEQTNEAMPRLAAEAPARGADRALPEAGVAEVRSLRAPKLDQQTVWRVIETLKSL